MHELLVHLRRLLCAMFVERGPVCGCVFVEWPVAAILGQKTNTMGRGRHASGRRASGDSNWETCNCLFCASRRYVTPLRRCTSSPLAHSPHSFTCTSATISSIVRVGRLHWCHICNKEVKIECSRGIVVVGRLGSLMLVL